VVSDIELLTNNPSEFRTDTIPQGSVFSRNVSQTCRGFSVQGLTSRREMSFAMGRPDTLGVDLYHNRQYPKIENEASNGVPNLQVLDLPQCAIIKCMVDFSRITRSVCLGIYLSASPPQRNLSLAFRIEQDLDSWLDNLPSSIRPSRTCESERSLKRIKDAQWMKKQRLVLSISDSPILHL
jgi:hypothetical protein